MRKSLLLFLVALIMPALAFAADNKALSKTHTVYARNNTAKMQETAFRVPYKVVTGHELPAQATDSYTLGMWFKLSGYFNANPDNSSDKKSVLMRLCTTEHLNLNGNFYIAVTTSGELVIGGHDGDNQGGAGTAGINVSGSLNNSPINLNTWYHLVFAVDNTNNRVAIYLNGAKIKEWATTTPMVYGGTLGWSDGIFSFADYGFSGALDEVQIWNKGLTDAEVTAVYNDATSGDGLVALYTFNTDAISQPNVAPNAASDTNGVYKLYQGSQWNSDGLISGTETNATSMTLVDGRDNSTEVIDPNPDPEPEPELNYCAPDGKANTWQNYFHSTRYFTKVDVSDGTSTVTVPGVVSSPLVGNSKFQQQFYYDKTSIVFTTVPGATISLTADGLDHWMCQYVYIDFGRDGVFNVDPTLTIPNNDLVTFTGYNPNGAPTSDCNGTPWPGNQGGQIDQHGGSMIPLPSFTLPTNMAPGTYRLRYIWCWNSVDPCFTTTNDQDKGTIFDITLVVEGEATPRTVTVATANADYGTATIQDVEGSSIETAEAVTVVATANEGYTFMNWTKEDGTVVSTNATYTYKGADDITLTANFGVVITIDASEGGAINVINTDNFKLINNGDVLVPGTNLRAGASPNTGYHLVSFTVNNEAVTSPYLFQANTNVTIKATFSDQVTYTVTISNATPDLGQVFVSEGMKLGDNGLPLNQVSNQVSGDQELYVFFIPSESHKLAFASVRGCEYESNYESDEDSNTYYFLYNKKNEFIDGTQTGEDAIEHHVVFMCGLLNDNLDINAIFDVNTAGIEGVELDESNAAAVYYNLQGVQVGADNLTPGIYVRRQGSKTVKVLVK